jgi:tRNA-splicing ligase RtcB
VCIGTVVATRRLLYPAAVGGDIGCGVAALRFDAASEALADSRAAAKVLAGLYAAVPCDRHRRADLPEWPSDVDPETLSAAPLTNLARHDGRAQLGTLGSGNHFIELQRDDEGMLWLMLHSGSRSMGQAVRAFHERHAAVTEAGLVTIDAESDAGRAYLADMQWAIRYADANRQLMVRAVASVVADALGAASVDGSYFACHHNHVRREQHCGEAVWVHRKGAIPAAEGELGIIPGSMGSPSFHVAGRGHPDALASSSHGAGRAMSRGDARRRISVRDVERQLSGVWFDRRLIGELRDEAPSAYKDIGKVMRAQHALTRIVRRVQPVLCFKGV